jgi:hypothetical protein
MSTTTLRRLLAQSMIGSLNRAKVLDAARRMFAMHGADLEDVGSGVLDGNHEAIATRVAELFPELER